MSTVDHLGPLPPALPRALLEPIEGVSLATYLIIEAARLDRLPVPAVLGWLGVRQSAFDRAEDRWSDRIAAQLAGDGPPFDELYEELLTRALSLWSRPVDPLDRDVVAWITYQRHALDAADPGELALGAGLTPGDELRLARLWRERVTLGEVAERAQAAWSGPLLPLPSVTVAPFVFPPAQAGGDPQPQGRSTPEETR